VFVSSCIELSVSLGSKTDLHSPSTPELESNSDEICVEVICRDTGIGIPSDIIPRLFQSFTQADARVTREFGGTGLGLAICAKLAKQMGGR
jgi:signal transduction histidine kinase